MPLVVGRVPVASKAYAAVLLFRALDVGSFLGLLVLAQEVGKRRTGWAFCPVAPGALLGALLAQVGSVLVDCSFCLYCFGGR